MFNIVSTLAADNNGIAQHNDVLNEAERHKIDRSTAEDILEKFHQEGQLFRPGGYGHPRNPLMFMGLNLEG
jgi:DNA replicative helicase MCM subunit Mcm2 (Cdc46/Mcm family)